MKKILIGLTLVAAIGCKTASKLPAEEMAKFSSKGYEVFYEGKAVAKYANKEYEYNKGEFIFEFSIIQYDPTNLDLTKKMAQYLATLHPDSKIEIKLQNDLDNETK